MTLETWTVERAIQGAKFFRPRLGHEVVLVRARIVNRWFTEADGEPRELVKLLDGDVTVIDPDEQDAKVKARIGTLRRSGQTPEELMKSYLDLASADDVPLVEDFPLHPEDETPEMRDLATTLQFRAVRAFEHHRGNTHLTLSQIIREVAEGSYRLGSRR